MIACIEPQSLDKNFFFITEGVLETLLLDTDMFQEFCHVCFCKTLLPKHVQRFQKSFIESMIPATQTVFLK